MRIAEWVLLILLACFLGIGASSSLSAAGAEGLLAVVRPAGDGGPMMVQFYTPDARLVHEMPLPADVGISTPALSPDGRNWVYLSGNISDPDDAEQEKPLQSDLTLHILRTSDGAELIAIPLLPSNFPENIAATVDLLLARDPSQEDDDFFAQGVWQSFRTSLGIFAWSPDGKQLAFSGATDGPSSDLYLYDVASGRVRRLTDGPEQINGIEWSPDGKWIWHTTIAYGYCQVCGGHNYAAAADGGGVVTLPGDDIYRFLAWVDNDSYLVTDQANGPGDFGLQVIDIATGESQMLWEGVHRAYVYDPAMKRLGIIGSLGKLYDPDEQVFVVNLESDERTEYDDLDAVLKVAPWLAPLKLAPNAYPCSRPGPFVYPCQETAYDPLSPDGGLLVGEKYAVNEVKNGDERLSPLFGLSAGSILWRPDGAGFFITQPDSVLYRELATGDTRQIEQARLLGWLPFASSADFPAPAPTESPTAAPTAVATAVITLPYRSTTLEGSYPETAERLRRGQTHELATLAQDLANGESPSNYRLRAEGLPLLVAHKAAATYLYPPVAQAPDASLEAQIGAGLDAALTRTPPWVATYPAGGMLPLLDTMALSPDGSVIATGHSDGGIRLWDYAGGNMLRVLPSASLGIAQLVFSSDSTMLAATDYEGRVQMWYVASGMKGAVHQGQYLNTTAIAWRPYSYDLAIANGQDPIVIHPRDGGAHALIDVTAEALAYSPNGSQLAIALAPRYPTAQENSKTESFVPEQRGIWIVDADSGEVLHELADDALTNFITYTPDSRRLVVVDGRRLRTWDVASATLIYESQLLDFAKGWALTKDGEEIALLSRQAGISFYDLSDGAFVRTLAVDADLLHALAINPLDDTLVSAAIGGRPLLLDPATGASSFHFGSPNARLVTTSAATRFFVTCDFSIITVRDLSRQRGDRELHDAAGYVTDLAISADGKWLAASEASGNLLLWDLDRGNLQWRVEVAGPGINSLAFTPDGDILIGDGGGNLRLVAAADGSVRKEMAMGDAITALAVSSRNQATIVVGRGKGIGWLLDMGEWYEGSNQGASLGKEMPVTSESIRFAQDKSDSHPVLEREVTVTSESDSHLRPLPVVDGVEQVYDKVAYSPDGALLAAPRRMDTGAEVTVEFWDGDGRHRLQTIDLGDAYNVEGIAFSPDGQQLAVGADGLHPITLWDVATGKLVQQLGDAKYSHNSVRLAYSPDGTQLFATSGNLMTTQYALTPSPRLRTIAGHDGDVWDLDVSSDGRWAITAGDDHHARVWDWQTGAQSYQAIAEPERIYSVDFSPDGNGIVTGGDEGIVRLYYASGELQRELRGHTAQIVDAIFSPDSKNIASASADGSVRVWDGAGAQQLWRVEGLAHGAGAIVYAPDGALLAGSDSRGPDTTIYLWDAGSGEEVRQLHGHHNYIVSLAFSPDGKLLASGSWDHRVKIWDVATGNEVATWAGFDDIVTDVAFSPDGKQVAAVAEDCTLRLWDVATDMEVRRIEMPRSLPWALAYSSDGHSLLTTHHDGSLRTWLVDAQDESLPAKSVLAAARTERATAEFSAQERSQLAIDSFVGAFPLSASANANWRPEPYVQSLIVQPQAGASQGESETLIALSNEKFLLSSVDQGESWRIVTRLPLTLTYHTLGIPARASDALLVTSEEGLYRVEEKGLTLIHPDGLLGVTYSQTNADEVWAVRSTEIVKSEDGGATWGEADNDLQALRLFAPLLVTAPNNNPQVVMVEPAGAPKIGLWRGAGNGFWQELSEMPPLPIGMAGEVGMAWEAGGRTLYVGGLDGELFASTTLDAPNIAEVTASVVENFGAGVRVVVLAVGEGPSLYLTLQSAYRPRLVRGVWDGYDWQWVELGLPVVPAG